MSLNTLQYYTGTQNGVLIIEVFAIQRFAIERFHCITYIHTCQGGMDTFLYQGGVNIRNTYVCTKVE